jgi:hypothetical protein
MRLLKRSRRRHPKLGIVLLDWSVRESFHLLHYLRQQAVPRDDFEVIVVEYFDRASAALTRFEAEVDTWALLEMPAACCYHKHLMYNAGIALTGAPLVLFCDSDAMVRETFVAAVLDQFDRDPDIVLHLDQFRNVRRDLYPFTYPTFDEVLGAGCINNAGGRTSGVVDTTDPLHTRNYGACMAAPRADLIAIGGADEHLDYLGHICGPYDMTFRLGNFGRREVWHQTEFLSHTWHPGQAGSLDYLGPHDGRHMSTTALEALATSRVRPLVENAAIARLRTDPQCSFDALARDLIAPTARYAWTIPAGSSRPVGGLLRSAAEVTDYRGFRIRRDRDRYVAHLIIEDGLQARDAQPGYSVVVDGESVGAVREQIDRTIGTVARIADSAGSAYVLGWRLLAATGTMAGRLRVKLRRAPQRLAIYAAGVVRRTLDRVHRFFLERSVLSGALGSLLVTLVHLQRQRQNGPREGRIPVILDTRAIGYYLQTLSRLGVVPPLNVVVSGDAGRLAAHLAELSLNGSSNRILVQRSAYVRHHAVFAASTLRSRIAVL